MNPPCAIATWFVDDRAEEATFFPQMGTVSADPRAKAAYWRCAVVFFASSLAVNPALRHVFYTNTDVPVVDGVDIAALFDFWGVEVVRLPIRWRLPKGSVTSWGNQFYIFDIIEHAAANPPADALIVLDSDCLWRRPATALVDHLASAGVATYRLDGYEHPEGAAINGLTREGLARFIATNGGPVMAAAPYFGGEIFAARANQLGAIAAQAAALWPQVLAQGPDAPREEAHLLSAIYALEGAAPGTANGFIRRMWTTFHHHNLAPADRDLAIWHLPAEKRTGFADLFRRITRDPALHPAHDGAAMGLDADDTARIMGYPRRPLRKLIRDLSLKICEKIGV